MKHLFSVKIAFLFFLCCIILFTGCIKPESSIGLGLQPETDLLDLVTTDTLSLDIFTVREDSLETDELSTAVLGRVFQPRIGWTTAGFATQLRLSAPGVNFGLNPQVDSLFLSLRFTGDTYGQLNPQSLLVQQLADSISLDSTYYSNFNPEVTHEILNDEFQGEISLNPSDDLIIGEDTIVSQIRLNLKPSLGQTILNQDTSVFSNNESWLDFFPGIVVSTQGDGIGAAGIDISSGLSLMRLHYHNDTDTSFYDFIISPLSARVNMFSQDYVAALSSLNSPVNDSVFVDGSRSLYIMSGAGLKTHIKIPFLEFINDSITESGDTVSLGCAIQKAELIFTLDDSYFDSRYPPQEQLYILTENSEGSPISTPDQMSLGVNIDGYYDSQNKSYRFNISRSIQHLLNRSSGAYYGNFSPENPIPPFYIVSSRAGISIQGVVLNGTDAGENRPRLVITYSH
ncbi:MAG: DUF4270 family protein [Flavobacteriales bacterium]|nr:DUF4270 family protein [Flavobacteriales bacterium]